MLHSKNPTGLPCVVQIGFAGSRHLFEIIAGSQAELDGWSSRVQEQLLRKLAQLHNELNLPEHYFLCGISQVAIGGDLMFTRACQRLNIPQRIFLPQPRDVYLAATGSNEQADFSPEERQVVEELLASDHIIQEQVVSDANDRRVRFEDCNREILRASDVVVCLFGASTEPKPGGTDEMLSLAQAQGKKVLELRVEIKQGRAQLQSTWHGPSAFSAPELPESIKDPSFQRSASPVSANGGLPSVSEFCGAVKRHASARAKQQNELFSRAALMIIGTHVFATLCAALVLAGHPKQPGIVWWMVALLGLELLLLLSGFGIHRWLHRTRPAQSWAVSRILAEINRSVRALGDLHIPPAYLFNLRLPQELAPLLRTINILHLRSTRRFAGERWEPLRDAYLANRLTDPDPRKGQIAFYEIRCGKEGKWLRWINGSFLVCSSLAILATAMKLALELEAPFPAPFRELCTLTLGTMAIFLPTFAVGALSWAAAKEYKARVQTFKAMLKFLRKQKLHFERATSRQDFYRLVQETETNLLGETADWFSRTTMRSVA